MILQTFCFFLAVLQKILVCNRFQRTKVNILFSKLTEILGIVLQAPIMGPLLFRSFFKSHFSFYH